MKRKELFICLFIFAALLPILSLRDFTPSNELRYLSVAEEALRNMNFFAFTNHGTPYADKPPLYIWIIMAGKMFFGSHQIWFLSLFSMLPALGCVLLMNNWTKNMLLPVYRLAAMLMLMSCGMFLGAAVVLRMDMLMCLFILLSLHTFYEMYANGNPASEKQRLLFPLYIFLAVFTKGALGFIIPFVSITAFLAINRKWKMIPFFWGWHTWLILLGGCMIWFGMVYYEGGSDYLQNLLVHQTVDRAVNSFAHNRPFYYYAYSIWYSMMPWSLPAISVIIASVFKRKLLCDDLSRFFLTVAACTLFILSLISSKIDIYLLPAYPFVIYLGVIGMQRLKQAQWINFMTAVPAAALAAAFPAFCILVSMNNFSFLGHTMFYIASAILTLTGIVSLAYLSYRKAPLKAICLISTGLFAAIFAGGLDTSYINDRLGYGSLCRQATAVAARYGDCKFSVWKLSRPENMDVYLHREVNILNQDKPLPPDLNKTILLLPKKELGHVSRYKNMYMTGENAIVVL